MRGVITIHAKVLVLSPCNDSIKCFYNSFPNIALFRRKKKQTNYFSELLLCKISCIVGLLSNFSLSITIKKFYLLLFLNKAMSVFFLNGKMLKLDLFQLAPNVLLNFFHSHMSGESFNEMQIRNAVFAQVFLLDSLELNLK